MTIKGLMHYLKNPKKWYAFFASRGLLNKMSDERFLKIAFNANLGKKLNLEDPKSFNEKLQWIKIHDRKPLYTELVDKFEVRKHVAEVIGQEHLISLVGGPWTTFDEIDFDKLPQQFVLKCTHDSGGLVICRDKAKLDKQKAREKIEKSLKTNYFWQSREWPYKNAKPRIIAEQYMEDENEAKGLTDYKFFCFNSEPRMIYISQGLEDHATASISFYDLNGEQMPFCRDDFKPIEGNIKLPCNFLEMTETARRLAEKVDCPFVRIDLYSIRGKMYFSEVTFSPCGGMVPFNPATWDDELGKWIELPINKG